MAIIKLGPMVVGIRGDVGGMIFSANKAGPYAKIWARPSNPRTLFQTTERGILGSMPELWRALSPALQAAWDTFAALPAQELFNSLGESYFISGFGWFTKTNIRLVAAGRATRTAVPILARPSAPTLTAFELPFLPEQYAKVTYPMGEFGVTRDLVLEVAVSISEGKRTAPPTFLTLGRAQIPPGTETGFLTPYNTRYNLTGPERKGFCLLYRQSLEGLRSSPTAGTFISSDASAYAATADDYDGATNFGLRGADLTGNADGKQGIFSAWFRVDAGDGTRREIVFAPSNRYSLRLTGTNRLAIQLRNAALTDLLFWSPATTFLAGAAWHHVIVAWDLATTTAQMYIDGVQETSTPTTGPIDDTIDYTAVNHGYGASTGSANLWDGCLSETYLNMAEYLDLDDPNNRALWRSANGKPQDLGPDGHFPTGNPPIVYIDGGDPSNNLATGGNYVNNAALVACSDAP